MADTGVEPTTTVLLSPCSNQDNLKKRQCVKTKNYKTSKICSVPEHYPITSVLKGPNWDIQEFKKKLIFINIIIVLPLRKEKITQKLEIEDLQMQEKRAVKGWQGEF